MRIHPEGHRLLKASGLGLLVLNSLLFKRIPRRASFSLLFTSIASYAGLASFYRQPNRTTPVCDGCVIAPADGRIVAIRKAGESEYLGDERIMISIFLTMFNVHANWTPVSGRVAYTQYHPGKYLVALHPKSSLLNEQNTVVIERDDGTAILVRQIAGLLARRIRCYVEEGQQVQAGSMLGFIKFGSRVDIFIPADSKINVSMYQHVHGGSTILAEL